VNPLSLWDACMDAGGRAKHGAVAERARERVIIRECTEFDPRPLASLSPTLSRRRVL